VRIGNAVANPKGYHNEETDDEIHDRGGRPGGWGRRRFGTDKDDDDGPDSVRVPCGNQTLAPGTYAVDRLVQSSAPVFRLWNARLRRSAIVLPQAQVDPQKGWAEGSPKLVFVCIGSRARWLNFGRV